jgi:IclR family transcriptional regulator, KDG regulon repressor
MDYTVAAVDEAIKLLFLVAGQPGLGLTELAKRAGITKARTFRLLTTLEQRDLVKRRGDPVSYCLSFQALHLGAAAHAQNDLVQSVREPIERLGRRFNETVAVRVRDGLETVSIARWESTQSLRVHGEVGQRHILYAGASSKILLAFAPPDVIEAVLAQERERFTPKTLVAKTALLAEIKRVREQGYAVSAGERVPDTAAIAVPIRDGSLDVVAALVLSLPATRMKGLEGQLLEALRTEALEVSRRLGYRPPA